MSDNREGASARPMSRFVCTDAMRSNDPLEAAEAYVDAGLKVVLLHGMGDDGECTCGKLDCKKFKHPIGKFFPKGPLSATRDKGLLRKVLHRYPNANLAITLDDMTVVDIDGPEGQEAFDALGLQSTLMAQTPRGFHHYYLGGVSSSTFKGQQSDVLTGEERYVLVSPSVGAGNKPYRWLRPVNAAIPAPRAIRKLRRKAASVARKRKSAIKSGSRNDTLFKIARSLFRHLGHDDVLPAVRAINQTACDVPLGDEEIDSIVRSAAKYGSDGEDGELFGAPSIRKSLPQEHLWYPYIPYHGLTILAGDPGAGKSLFIALLVAIVTGGGVMPLSKEHASGKRVLLLSAEDNFARVTLRRLENAGFDISNLHTMRAFRTLSDDRLAEMENHMRSWKPEIVIVDTITAYMGAERDMNRQNEVGEFLARLNEIVEDLGSAILCVAHLNKQSTENPLYRIVGSIGFAASIRSALFFGRDPENRQRIALAHGKANGAPLGPTIIFDMVGGGRNDAPVLKAVEHSDLTANDFCRIPRGPVGRPSAEREAAIAFVLATLTEAPITWDRVQRMAESRSIASASTLALVRAELAKDGRIVQVGKGKVAKWVRSPDSEEQ